MSPSASPKGLPGAKAAPRLLELTPRQRQILSLICKGKVNKEIARELDISLGTVKQHIVALFKRMNVQNRSMAVAQSKDLLTDDQSTEPPIPIPGAIPDLAPNPTGSIAGADWADDILLIRRPCIVLALAVPPSLEPDARQGFNKMLAALAAEARAFYLSRGEQGSILLFGVRKPSVWEAIKALLLLQHLCNRAAEQGWVAANALTAALDCGMAVISIDASGRWSGDTVATPVISVTRRLLVRCPAGTLGLGATFRHLLQVFHSPAASGLGNPISLGEIDRLLAIDLSPTAAGVLHQPQWQRLVTALKARSEKIFQLLGCLGSGKSHLCRALVAWTRTHGGEGFYLRVLPDLPAASLRNADTGARMPLGEIVPSLLAVADAGDRLLIIDDVDLLPPADRAALVSALELALAEGCLIVLTARAEVTEAADTILLGGLDAAGLEQLLEHRASAGGPSQGQDVQALLECTQGIPLFALEWSAPDHSGTHQGTPSSAHAIATQAVTLPVLLAVASELDQHQVDWRLLRALAEMGEESRLERIQELTALSLADVEKTLHVAVGAGLLKLSATDGTLDFASPLVRQVVSLILV